jgi:hypothetical protein
MATMVDSGRLLNLVVSLTDVMGHPQTHSSVFDTMFEAALLLCDG